MERRSTGIVFSFDKEEYVVSGDCGGTNTRLSLWAIPKGAVFTQDQKRPPGELVVDQKYLNEKFGSFVEVCRDFLGKCRDTDPRMHPNAACLACAGPIVDNSVSFTNVAKGWDINGHVLEAELNIPCVLLINDFTAMGYGLLTVDDSECYILNDIPVRRGAPIATVGAGTGLGECYLTKDSHYYHCWASEGGHVDYSPRTDLEIEMFQFLKKKFGENSRISQERVISGIGLSNAYEFLVSKYPHKVDNKIHEKWEKAGSLRGAIVGENAGNNELCELAMRMFMSAYGAEAGNAILKWLPSGGFYVTGGLVPKNLKWLKDEPEFTQALYDKGRMSKLIKNTPIKVVLADDVGERGAHLVAVQLLMQVRDDQRVHQLERLRSSPKRPLLPVNYYSISVGLTIAAISIGLGIALGRRT